MGPLARRSKTGLLSMAERRGVAALPPNLPVVVSAGLLLTAHVTASRHAEPSGWVVVPELLATALLMLVVITMVPGNAGRAGLRRGMTR